MLMFLKSVGEALVAKGLGALKGFVPFGNVVCEVGADAIDRYRKAKREAQIAADAEALLKAEMKEVRAEAERIIREVAKGESEEIIDLAVAYLTQMPGAIRQSLKRADDPTGTTIPATLNLADAVQLSAVLPQRLSTYRSGDPVPHAPQWRFVELLGAGGFGEVWLAKHVHLNRPRAFKFCLDAASRARLMAHEMAVVDRVMEASKAVTDADHGIVPLLDCHFANDSAWLAYEYIDGGDLTAWARANALLPAAVRAANALNMVRDLAGVVGSFHALSQPVVHRDLKPANVLLKKASGRWLIRVTDFGISHVGASAGIARATVSTPSMSLGDTFRGAHTPTYASPQQKKGDPADPRDDVHALGIIALQLLLGDLSAERPSGNSWRKKLAGCEVSGEVLELLARCWDDDPDERPSNAGEMLGDLLLSEKRAHVVPANPSENEEPSSSAHASSGKAEVAPVTDVPTRTPTPSAGGRYEISLPGGVMMDFAWCPPGAFLMGSPRSEKGRNGDENQHQVTLTKGFWIGVTPTTREQFATFVSATGYKTDAETDGGGYWWKERLWQQSEDCTWRTPGFEQADDHPVVTVSYKDAFAFSRWLATMAGKQARLPTEAQWEYAARGGTVTQFYWGTNLNGKQANCDGSVPYSSSAGRSLQKTTPVGSFAEKYPHPWGLADMIGNVWEWCRDCYDPEYYAHSPIADPRRKGESQEERVLRGGSWMSLAGSCRAAYRNKGKPTDSFWNFGFRLVLLNA